MPTRFTEHSATLIDNIFTNQLVDHESGILTNSISDHQMIFSYSKDKKIYKRQSKYIEVEVNNENALNALLIELQNLNLFEQISSNTSADPNTNFENFMNVLSQAKQKCMPKKLVKFDKKKHKQSPWMTNGILNSINSKNKMYRNLLQTDPNSDRYNTLKVNYKTYKNIIRRSIMLAKRQYYHTTFSRYSSNLKKTWRTINDILNRGKGKNNLPLTFKSKSGDLISGELEIANEFNDFFVNIGGNIENNKERNDDYSRYLNNKPKSKLCFKEITAEVTLTIINDLKPKSSSGIDEISNKTLKYLKNEIAAPLTIIINQMLHSGIFPDALKVSKVIPLYKKDDKQLFSNYRPISLLPSISKIFEKVILLQLTEYLDKNNILHQNQYGFRKNHSTELASLHLVDYIYYTMDANEIPLNVYIDLSKAFDSLNHKILLSKLKFYGVTGLSLDLLYSYLSNRKQCTLYNSTFSDFIGIKQGVPQGSILGPLLFSIYINDLPSSSNLFDFLMYADDTTLFCSIDKLNRNDRNIVINEHLDKVSTWMKSNKLVLNSKKTKYMLFHKHNKIVPTLELKINDNSIDQVSTFNFLGLHINSQLTWQTHIDEISKKISRVIGLIYKLQYILPQKILLSLYNTLILPQINYCILLWGKESKSILLLQKRAIRAVSSAGFRAHSEPLFKIHNVLKVDDIYQQRLLVFYYNVVNNIISANFNDFLPVLSVGSHSYPIRNPQRQLPKHSHEYIKLSCRYQLTILSNEIFSITGKYYNTIIAEIFGNVRHIPVVSFKRYIKTYFLKKYSYLCHVDNCYMCQV